MTEQKAVISKEEIMSLPDLNGYWKYGDVVVPFRLPVARVKLIAKGYIPRTDGFEVVERPSLRPTVSADKASSLPVVVSGTKELERREHLQRKPKAAKKLSDPDQPKFEYSIPAKETALPEKTVAISDEPLSKHELKAAVSTPEISAVDPELEEAQIDFT